jgi:hypothetical protein
MRNKYTVDVSQKMGRRGGLNLERRGVSFFGLKYSGGGARVGSMQ